ncbi:MAG: GntR family transcriptional regulator [Pseudomonadota bacterium]
MTTAPLKSDHRFPPIRKVPAYLKVRDAIEAEILAGRLAEGAFLPTESDLCTQLDVNRSTVREGIRLLETSGLVERGAGKRLRVRRPGTGDVALSTSRALTFSGVTVLQAWDALALFQPQMAASAATRFGPAEIKALEATHTRLTETPADDFENIVLYTDDFFACIAVGFDNPITTALLAALNRLTEAGLRQVVAAVPDARTRIITAQANLITALKKQDADTARLWMTRHIDDLRRGFDVAGLSMDTLIV